MEGAELHPVSKCFPKLPLWIIEYIWAHKMLDIREVVDSSTWPEMDSQPLSLEDSWRLRVASAQVYSIMKNRDIERFERVMGFLDDIYRLLPKLVAPIKHMKIMFGLKTMVIMWMFREGQGLVDIVFKINRFFPSKLLQYQDQCSQHEMFLMRKNHVDFKALAQALAMDKDKLEDYIKNQMEEQYGEHYAQKVEDRLLYYLHRLETVLPGDTHIDKILRKQSPATEEEKLLLEIITSDSTTIATTLKKLLHCDAASCRLGRASQSSVHVKKGMESCQLSMSVLQGSSSRAPLKSVEAKSPPDFQPVVFKGREEAVEEDSPLLLETDKDSDVRRHHQTEEGGEIAKWVEEESSDKDKEEVSQSSSEHVQGVTSSPQFCSKHQRWVKSILQECPDEYSEELLLRASVSSSPLLFQLSSSTSSSQDLTPSNLNSCPPDQQHPPTQMSTHQAAAQASQDENPEDKLSSGSTNDTSQKQKPSSSRDTQLPALLSPVVRLMNIASVSGIYLKPHQASPNHFIMSNNKQAAFASSPHILTTPQCHTSETDAIPQGTSTIQDSMFDQLETVAPTNPLNTTSTSTSSQPPSLQSFSRLSRKFRQVHTTTRHSQALVGFSQKPLAEQFKKAPTQDASTSTSQSGTLSSVCTSKQIPLSTESSRQVVPHNSIKPHCKPHNISPSKALPCFSVISSTSNSNFPVVRSEPSRVQRAQPKLSLPSQAVLLKSNLLQPCVSLTRLSTQECYQVTKGRSSTSYVEPVVQGSNQDNNEEEEELADSSFDINLLYSSYSSSNDSEDSFDRDPDYKPWIRKKQLLLEYENARSLNQT